MSPELEEALAHLRAESDALRALVDEYRQRLNYLTARVMQLEQWQRDESQRSTSDNP